MKTDSSIQTDVENELRWDPSVDEKAVLVKVEKSKCGLRSKPRTSSEKFEAHLRVRHLFIQRASKSLSTIPRLTKVENELQVQY
jgi:hypothetical protein